LWFTPLEFPTLDLVCRLLLTKIPNEYPRTLTELNGVGENTEFDFVARGQLEGGDKQKTGRFIVAGILSFVSFPCSALFVIVLGLSLSPDPQVFKPAL
jgi:hypothetical protein